MVIRCRGQPSQRLLVTAVCKGQLRHVTPGTKAQALAKHAAHGKNARFIRRGADRAQQAERVVEVLLHPSQELFSDAAGVPTKTDVTQTDALHRHEFTALASLRQLEDHFRNLIKQGGSLLPVTESEGHPQHKSHLIEELSAEHAGASEAKLLHTQLVLNSCLAAALYAVDTSLLTPWTSHQLDLAGRKLLHTICAACTPATSKASYTNATADSEHNNLLPMLPLLLPQLQAVLMQDYKRHDNLQSPKQQGMLPHCLQANSLVAAITVLQPSACTALADSAH